MQVQSYLCEHVPSSNFELNDFHETLCKLNFDKTHLIKLCIIITCTPKHRL